MARGEPGNIITIEGPRSFFGLPPLLPRRRRLPPVALQGGEGVEGPANGGSVMHDGRGRRWFCPDEIPTGMLCVPLDGNTWCNPTPPFAPTFGGHYDERGYYCNPLRLPRWAQEAAQRWRARAAGAGVQGLGDIYYTGNDCAIGDAAVAQMVQTIATARQQGKAEPFETSAQNIYASWERLNSFVKRFGTAYQICGTVREIGNQAEALTHQMQVAMGQVPAPEIIHGEGPSVPPSERAASAVGDALLSALKWTLGLAIAGGAIYGGARLYRSLSPEGYARTAERGRRIVQRTRERGRRAIARAREALQRKRPPAAPAAAVAAPSRRGSRRATARRRVPTAYRMR